MADERLRELERLAQSEGGLEAQVELLHYRLRQGDLSGEWLATAAHLGHKAARNTLGRFVPVATYATIRRSLSVDTWPRELALRAAVGWLEPTATGRLERAALAILAYVEAPSEARRTELEEQRPGARDPVSTILDMALLPEAGAAQRLLRTILPEVSGGRGSPDSDRVRDLREALQPYALLGYGTPPAKLLPPDPAAWESFGVAPAPREDLFQDFRKALKDPDTLAESEALEAALQQGTLNEERVRLAALLGSPAAWCVCEPPGQPDLAPPGRASLMAGSILSALARVSKGQPRDPLVREDLLRNLRSAPDDAELGEGLTFPPWWRALYARMALDLAERLAEEGESSQRSQEVVATAKRLIREDGSAEELLQGAHEIAWLAESDPEPASVTRPVAAALRLVAALQTDCERPRFRVGAQHVLELALQPGPLLHEELWSLLRESAIEWLLAPGDQGARRSYDPSHHYTAGDHVLHPTFGPGEVTAVRRDRIDVAFTDQERTLVHKG